MLFDTFHPLYRDCLETQESEHLRPSGPVSADIFADSENVHEPGSDVTNSTEPGEDDPSNKTLPSLDNILPATFFRSMSLDDFVDLIYEDAKHFLVCCEREPKAASIYPQGPQGKGSRQSTRIHQGVHLRR
jgi:hypothetical protein